MKAKWISIGVNVCRFIVALTFIFSGFVKAIDPLGTQYKINDYLQALGCEGIVPPIVTLGISVLLSAVEFYTGMMLLFAINRRVMSRVAVGFMVIMTIVVGGQPDYRLRLFRRCSASDQRTDIVEERGATGLCGSDCMETTFDGEVHQQEQPMDCEELYGHIHHPVKYLVPLRSADL